MKRIESTLIILVVALSVTWGYNILYTLNDGRIQKVVQGK